MKLTRSMSRSIRRTARLLVQGRIGPAAALDEIVVAARVSQPPGQIDWEEASIWPIYAPFFSIAARWWEAQQQGDVPREVAARFEAEVADAAHALLEPG